MEGFSLNSVELQEYQQNRELRYNSIRVKGD